MVLAVPGVIDQVMRPASDDLRRRHGADEQWPLFDSDLLDDLKKAAPKAVQRLFGTQAWYMSPVLHAPIAMAYRAFAKAQFTLPKPDKIDLYQLQQLRDFDPDWYREAFGLTTLFLYATDSFNA
jgi:hypothetical protein